MKVKTLSDVRNILNQNKTNFILNLEEATLKQKSIIISFMAGLTYKNGNIKKLDINNFEIIL